MRAARSIAELGSTSALEDAVPAFSSFAVSSFVDMGFVDFVAAPRVALNSTFLPFSPAFVFRAGLGSFSPSSFGFTAFAFVDLIAFFVAAFIGCARCVSIRRFAV